MRVEHDLKDSLDTIYEGANKLAKTLNGFDYELEKAGFKPLHEMGISDKVKAGELLKALFEIRRKKSEQVEETQREVE